MKLRTVLYIFLISIILVGLISSVFVRLSLRQEEFTQKMEESLVSSILVKGERINDFIFETENDALLLADSRKTKEVLELDIGKEEIAAILDVNGEIDTIAKEIENYLRAHPNMNETELKNSKELEAIAVQDIGQKGYSALLSIRGKEVYFHNNPKMNGVEIEELGKRFPRLGRIFDDLNNGSNSKGFYSWEDADGIVREKYGEFYRLSTKTSYGAQLVSFATAYFEDYNVAQNVSEELEKYFDGFCNLREYYNILLVSPEGNVVYMATPMGGLGTNVKFASTQLSNAYLGSNNLKKGEVSFYGPFKKDSGDTHLKITTASKIYNGDEFLGSVFLIKNIDGIDDILGRGISGIENEEIYLIDENALLLTEMKSGDVDVLVQEIFTEGATKCLENFEEAERRGITVEEYKKLEERNLLPFLDFKGEKVLGLHSPICKVHWCLLSEVNAEEAVNAPLKEDIKNVIGTRIWLLVFLVLSIFIAGLFVDKKYVLVRAKTELIEGTINFLRKTWVNRIGLFSIILIGIIFATVYFFIITSFFQGWQNAKFFDDIPDLMIFIVGILFIVYCLKIKDKVARKFVFLGGTFICVERLFEVFLQEYQAFVGNILNAMLWAPVFILGLIGYLFLLMGFRRLKHDL